MFIVKILRYVTIAATIAATLAALACSFIGQARGDEKTNRPNIIVILADDMGYSDLGCYGGEIRTPNLDRLAQGGLRFSQFYNNARCCPSRATLLTGRYSHQVGVGHMINDHGLEGYQGNMSHQFPTIAELLRPAGYETYMAGKWHVTKNTTPDGPKDNWPRQRGFDHFYGTIRGAGSYFDPCTLVREETMISPFADPDYEPKRFYYTDAITDHAIRWIGEHGKSKTTKPFFLYVAYTAAHWPMQALEEDIAKYHGKYDGGYEPIRRRRFEQLKKMKMIDPAWELSTQVGDWDKVANKAWEARCMEVYAAMVDHMDQGVGRIVDELTTSGQLDNTIILFLEDNGACQEPINRVGHMTRPDHPTLPPIAASAVLIDVQPKQNRRGVPTLGGVDVMPGPEDTYISYGENWANVSNTPFRYYKHFDHEGGISTPLIAYWPRGIARRGEIDAQPGHLIDIMATCLDLAGVNLGSADPTGGKHPLEGKSLVPVFQGNRLPPRPLFWEHDGNRAVRIGDWKLVARGAGGPWELYNMVRDRTEMHDQAASDPARVAELAAQWKSWATRVHCLPWPWKPRYGEKAKPGDEKATRKAKGAKPAPGEAD